MKRLRHLSIDGNSGADDGVKAELRKNLPCLVEFDGASVARELGDFRDLVKDTQERSIRSPVQDNASCSCVFGNPCAEKYNVRMTQGLGRSAFELLTNVLIANVCHL